MRAHSAWHLNSKPRLFHHDKILSHAKVYAIFLFILCGCCCCFHFVFLLHFCSLLIVDIFSLLLPFCFPSSFSFVSCSKIVCVSKAKELATVINYLFFDIVLNTLLNWNYSIWFGCLKSHQCNVSRCMCVLKLSKNRQIIEKNSFLTTMNYS